MTQVAINLNGEVLPADWPIFLAHNRAFRYGDALFETIRIQDGRMPFLPYHYERLARGAALLGMEWPQGFSLEAMQTEIQRLDVSEGIFRIRFSLFRDGGGTYAPLEYGCQFLVEKRALTQGDAPGLLLGISKEKGLYPHPLSSLKTANCLPYVLAALEQEQRGLDDLLLQNQAGELAEAVSSNLFVVMRRKIITPPLSSGCVAGTTRAWLLEQEDWKVEEKTVTPDKLQRARGLFLTNAVQGIRWVAGVGNLRYKKADVIQGIQQHWAASWAP